MPSTTPTNFNDIQFPTSVQYHWRAYRHCSFLPTQDCIEAVLREIVRVEKCSYLRAYFDLDTSPEVRELAACYYVEFFRDGEDEPYRLEKVYIPRTVANKAIDASSEIMKSLSGISTLIQGDVWVVSATELSFQ